MKLQLSIISIFFIFFIHQSYAQKQPDFRLGYIITSKSDTLYGEIEYKGDASLAKECRFKAKETTIVKRYIPSSIKAYRFIDSRYFISEKIEQQYVFLEVLVDGELDIYYYRDNKRDHYFIKREGLPLKELPYGEDIITTKEGRKVINPQSRYLAYLKYYTADAPKTQSYLSKNDKIGHKNLIRIAKDYHSEICSGKECIVYHKKNYSVKATWEIATSFGMLHRSSNKLPSVSIFTHLWLPRLNEKIYLKVGLSSTWITKGKTFEGFKYPTSEQFWMIPLQVEYMPPLKSSDYKLAFGWTLIEPLGQVSLLPSASIGFNKPLSEKLKVTLNYDVLFRSGEEPLTYIIPNDFFSHSFSLGILFKMKK